MPSSRARSSLVPTVHLSAHGLLSRRPLAGLLALGLGLLGCSDTNKTTGPESGNDAGTGGKSGSGDGGADTASCTTTPNVCDTELVLDPLASLSDFENGVEYLANVDGRRGSWWSSGDGTSGALLTPDGAAKPENIPGGRCGSQKAVHVTGSGFLDWGSTLSLTFNWGANDAGVEQEHPWNGSAYKGITFWAKVGDTSGTTVRFGISDQYARPEAGLCTIGGGAGKECYDTFGVELPNLDTTWKKYRITFASLTQRNFGVPSPKLDTTQLYQLEFMMQPNTIFDFWLDDVALY